MEGSDSGIEARRVRNLFKNSANILFDRPQNKDESVMSPFGNGNRQALIQLVSRFDSYIIRDALLGSSNGKRHSTNKARNGGSNLHRVPIHARVVLICTKVLGLKRRRECGTSGCNPGASSNLY